MALDESSTSVVPFRRSAGASTRQAKRLTVIEALNVHFLKDADLTELFLALDHFGNGPVHFAIQDSLQNGGLLKTIRLQEGEKILSTELMLTLNADQFFELKGAVVNGIEKSVRGSLLFGKDRQTLARGLQEWVYDDVSRKAPQFGIRSVIMGALRNDIFRERAEELQKSYGLKL